MTIITPNKEKIKIFLIAPIAFSVLASAFTIYALGFHVGALLTCLVLFLVICAPFALFILPTFLFEKIIIEDFTATFYFMFLFFRVKRVLIIEEIEKIEERFRNDRRGSPKVLRFVTKSSDLFLSEPKYTKKDLEKIITTFKKKNPNILVTYLTEL